MGSFERSHEAFSPVNLNLCLCIYSTAVNFSILNHLGNNSSLWCPGYFMCALVFKHTETFSDLNPTSLE